MFEVTAWGTVPWEFANFTDAELAGRSPNAPPSAWHDPAGPCSGAEGRAGDPEDKPERSPNVEAICRTWPDRFRKLELAEELWPCLKVKVNREVASGERLRVPAARVGVRALQMATESARRNVALRVR